MIITIKTSEKVLGKTKADKLENKITEFMIEEIGNGTYEIWSKDVVRIGEIKIDK